MAKYIKTEEGYKLFKEIEDNMLLTEGPLIEIEDNTISCTLGKPTKVLGIINEKVHMTIKSVNFEIRDYISFKEYVYEIPLCITLNNSDLAKSCMIKIKKKTDADFRVYWADFGSSAEDGYSFQVDRLRIELVLEQHENNLYTLRLNADSTYEGMFFQLSTGDQEYRDGYIKVPNEALSLDDAPTEDSVNLLTSGSIYTVIQELQTRIKILEDTQISAVTNNEVPSNSPEGAE